MKITQEEVTHVANLSKLKFSEEETAEFATTLSKIVDMVELLGEVDTTGVAPTTTMADRKTVLRPDVAEKGTDRDRLFKKSLIWGKEDNPHGHATMVKRESLR